MLAVGKPPWPSIDVDKAIPWVEQRTKLTLADSQKAALRVALGSNVMVITGGPGVGKTTELSPNLGDGLRDQAAAVWDCEDAEFAATSIPSVNLTP